MADSQGNPPPNGGQGTDPPEGPDAPKYVTAEELNRAITARFGDFEKKQSKGLTALFADRDTKLATALTDTLTERFGTALDEKLAAFKPKEPEEKKPPGTDATPLPLPKVEDSPAFKAMMKKLEGFENQAKVETEARKAADAKRRDVELRSALSRELAAHEITGARADLAMAQLVDARKLVYHRPESDELVFKCGEDELPLTDGLKSWVGSDQGKILLPPKGTQGSGDGPARGGGGAPNPNNPLANLSAQLLAHVRKPG